MSDKKLWNEFVALEKERDAMRAELDALRKEADKFSDGVDWIQRAMQAEAELDALKRQEPVAWLIDWADEPDLGHYFSESAVDEDSGRSRPLFLHPVPAQSVPDGWKLVPMVSTYEMDMAGSSHCDGYLSRAQMVWDAMLAAAPEAKL